MRLTTVSFFLLIAAVSLVLPTSSVARLAQVNIGNFFFAPDTVRITMGDTVRWTNTVLTLHTTTSDSLIWNSGNLGRNQTFDFQFTNSGRFPYHCAIHPLSMKGVVLVSRLRQHPGHPPALTLKHTGPGSEIPYEP